MVQGRRGRGAARPIRASPTPRAPSSTPAAICVVYAASNGFTRRLPQLELLARGRPGGDAERHRCSATTGTACSATSAALEPPEAIGRTAAARAAAPPRRAQGPDLRGAGGVRSRHGRQPAPPPRRRRLGQRALQGHVVPHRQARRARSRRAFVNVDDDGTLRRRPRLEAVRRRGPADAAHARWSRAACCAATCSTPTRRASCRAARPATRRARSPIRRTSARPTSSSPPATASPEEIIGSVASGLYVTELMGFGVNPTTGDYSRGASGLWIENGELAYPVERDHHRRQPAADVPATSRWSATTSSSATASPRRRSRSAS